jgi:carbonic anhydrase
MTSSPASAQSTVSPDEALKAMMDGNDRFVAGQLRSFDLKNL